MSQNQNIQVSVREFDGRNQKFLVLEPERAHSCLIAYPGYDGDLDLLGEIPRKLTYNFFVRNRVSLAKFGYKVVIVDSPAMFKSAPLTLATEHRRSRESIEAFDDLLRLLDLGDMPYWLCGTSRSPETILNIMNDGERDCAGLVLLSCLTADNDGSISITKVPADRIQIPVLVVHHALDRCSVSNPDLIPFFLDRISSVRKKLVMIRSGTAAEGADPCKGNALHGFWGADQEVMTEIDRFIKNV